MRFQEQIGRPIFVYMRSPILLTNSNTLLKSFKAKVVGVEAGGVWIENEELADEFSSGQELIWESELKRGGPEEVGSTAMRFFLPFSEVSLILGFDAA